MRHAGVRLVTGFTLWGITTFTGPATILAQPDVDAEVARLSAELVQAQAQEAHCARGIPGLEAAITTRLADGEVIRQKTLAPVRNLDYEVTLQQLQLLNAELASLRQQHRAAVDCVRTMREQHALARSGIDWAVKDPAAFLAAVSRQREQARQAQQQRRDQAHRDREAILRHAHGLAARDPEARSLEEFTTDVDIFLRGVEALRVNHEGLSPAVDPQRLLVALDRAGEALRGVRDVWAREQIAAAEVSQRQRELDAARARATSSPSLRTNADADVAQHNLQQALQRREAAAKSRRARWHEAIQLLRDVIATAPAK
jgi:hypothetical protein